MDYIKRWEEFRKSLRELAGRHDKDQVEAPSDTDQAPDVMRTMGFWLEEDLFRIAMPRGGIFWAEACLIATLPAPQYQITEVCINSYVEFGSRKTENYVKVISTHRNKDEVPVLLQQLEDQWGNDYAVVRTTDETSSHYSRWLPKPPAVDPAPGSDLRL